ncbi:MULTISPECIES: hypothetical protein [unclassified Pseudovibrio]|uniref:hypothetical protein n=1 Tax=unclassified Pseudovibrio TaxID=2627060 RepID=UPI0007AE87ED|nr:MULTISPECIES: hypothetical protein [unclassified Pseudovibrio]KZK97275.1 hypothetical protein PsW74_03715 [Pseudovibrio sp. W74]KZL08961.1 hypothetical protein PsAD14_02540 [Pseudovibrio sp. Ad14]
MELKEFVTQSLQQILEGVREAQTVEGGDNINAGLQGIKLDGNLINGGTYGVFSVVEFDVAVSAEHSGSGKAALKVFGVGVEGGGQTAASYANKIKFSVPVRLPDGDPSRVQQQTAKRAALPRQTKALSGRNR